jgi:hypothetical protein
MKRLHHYGIAQAIYSYPKKRRMNLRHWAILLGCGVATAALVFWGISHKP